MVARSAAAHVAGVRLHVKAWGVVLLGHRLLFLPHKMLTVKAERQNPLWLGNPEKTSPEIQNRGIEGPKIGHVNTRLSPLGSKARNEMLVTMGIQAHLVNLLQLINEALLFSSFSSYLIANQN